MSYLKQRRSQLILAAFLVSSLLLAIRPELDLRVSGLFYDGRFALADQWWNRWLHANLGWCIGGSMAAILALYAFNQRSGKRVLGVEGRTVCYLALVLLIGGGLIVNVAFKDHFGRARPRDIQEFGGASRFTPAFTISDQCSRNCSFSSGEAAGGFFGLALARALGRRRSALIAAVGVGIVVSLGRITAGAHFLSDTLVSFFVMLIVSDLLFYLMKMRDPTARS